MELLQFKISFCLTSLFLISQFNEALSGATEEQMLAAGKLMRNVCQPKFASITNEVGDQIKKGNVPDTKEAKCYINCVMEMMQSMKKGKFQYESSIKQVDILLPDDYKDEYRAGIEKCKTSAIGIKNHCDAAFAVFKCMAGEIKKFAFP